MFKLKPENIKERRKSQDFWAKVLFFLNMFAWGLMAVLFFIFHKAQPEFETMFDRFYHLNLRTNWDLRYLLYLIYAVGFGIVISIFGLILGIYRGRRKTDHKKALIIVGVISLLFLGVWAGVILG